MTEPIDWEAKARELAVRWGYIFTGAETLCKNPSGEIGNRPEYEKSVDALIADMPDDWEVQISARVYEGKPHVNVWINGNRYAEGVTGKDRKEATAHALLLACLAMPE